MTLAATLEERFVIQPPPRLIGDKAYDSDRLDQALSLEGVELIAPNRKSRRERTQDGRRAVAGGAGRSKGCSPGCITSAAS